MAKLALVAPNCDGSEPIDGGSVEFLLYSVANDFLTLSNSRGALANV